MSKINIHNIRRRNPTISNEDILQGKDSQAYLFYKMDEIVADSQVDRLFLNKQVIREIYDWVKLSLTEQPVKEVGGFILGKVAKAESRYDVCLEQFVPAKEVNFNSVTRLEFGHKVLADLSNAMEDSRYINLAWFHTHPGHTAFLSNTDMKIHEVYYTEPYQVAIVLDSLTDDFDTGIFTRKIDGQVNNKPDIQKWVTWRTLFEELQNTHS